MLERFTERARQVVVLATEEARSRRHEMVGPEHLLMGLLQVGGDFAVHSLEQLGVSPEAVRAEVERVLGASPPGSATGSEPAFSPELKAVLEGALAVKRRRTVDPELLLLALLAEEHSAVSGILHATGADLAKARRLPVRMMSVLNKPVTEEEVHLIATSRWRVRP
jgi:ATP-dependent Clp protease ATP-binding subunit ClpC